MYKTVIALAVAAIGITSAFAQTPDVAKDNAQIRHEHREINRDNRTINHDKNQIHHDQSKLKEERSERNAAARQEKADLKAGNVEGAQQAEAKRDQENHEINGLKRNEHHAHQQANAARRDRAHEHHELNNVRKDKKEDLQKPAGDAS